LWRNKKRVVQQASSILAALFRLCETSSDYYCADKQARTHTTPTLLSGGGGSDCNGIAIDESALMSGIGAGFVVVDQCAIGQQRLTLHVMRVLVRTARRLVQSTHRTHCRRLRRREQRQRLSVFHHRAKHCQLNTLLHVYIRRSPSTLDCANAILPWYPRHVSTRLVELRRCPTMPKD
jgi:hypothetical protein